MKIGITLNHTEVEFLEKHADDFLLEYAELAMFANPKTKTAQFSALMVNAITQIKRQIKPESIGERGNI
ncbi:MAG: hypothetical protein QMC67_05385 [Candidatus Wallbacteria bacterium]